MLGKLLGCEVVGLRLVNPHYYHLDTCFCPLAEGLAVWYPDAFDAGSQKQARDGLPHLIEVSANEAARFACNAIVLGREMVLPDGCPELGQMLGRCGYRPHAVPMSEFIRAGGACKCLVLMLEHDHDGGAV